jgi:hypothetical protein
MTRESATKSWAVYLRVAVHRRRTRIQRHTGREARLQPQKPQRARRFSGSFGSVSGKKLNYVTDTKREHGVLTMPGCWRFSQGSAFS